MSDDLFAPGQGSGASEPGEGEGAGAGAGAVESAGAEPVLEQPAGPAAPAIYREPQRVYADRYGMSVRSVKGWIADGRAAGKLPPLDDAEAMLVWWHDVKTNRAPARLLVAAETAKLARLARAPEGNGAPEKIAESASAGGGEGTPPPPAAPPAAPVALEVGFLASLNRVREAEARANVDYLTEREKRTDISTAEGGRDDARLSRLRREWSELNEQLRFLEKAAPDVLTKSGEVLTKSEVRRLLARMHGPIVSGVRSLFRRTRAKLGANSAGRVALPAVAADAPEADRIAAAVAALAELGASLEDAVAAVAGRKKLLDDLEALYAAEVERLFGELVASEFAPVA